VSGFVDECGLCVKGGDGGAGAVSMRREAHVAKGGPDGGDGGHGGSVWLQADHNVASLLSFRDHPHRRAGSGAHGQGKRRHGAGADDLIVHVPVGTLVRDPDGTVLADLGVDGQRWLASKGGTGGRGNARFLSNSMRAPSFAEQGEVVAEQWLRLELKLFADIALVGFPNVGKSTLIARISAARPKIADYPFTTLEPNLGVVDLDDGASIIVADIPGLIEGAADGKGLGHQFLRHVERARALVVLLDAAEWDGTSMDEQERILLDELGRFRADLLDRPRLVVESRIDLVDRPPRRALAISAVTGEGIPELIGAMASLVVDAREADPVAAEELPVIRPHVPGVWVDRGDDAVFVVHGRAARRAVALSDLTDGDAQVYMRKQLKKVGVDRALARAGARPGDTVRIGDLEFDYEADEPLP
jgi:GTP-binding protein